MINAAQVAVTSTPKATPADWIVPFAAAFAGAFFAFLFERLIRRKEDRNRKIMAGDQALFALHQQLQDMLTLYNHIGKSGWTAPFAMIMSQLRIDRSSLVFLRREHPDDLNKILEAERWYSDVCDSLQDFNEKANFCNATKLGNVPANKLALLRTERNRVHNAMIQTIRMGVKYNHISTRTLHRILISMFKRVKFSVPGANKEVAKQFDDLNRQFNAVTDQTEKNKLREQIDALVFNLYMSDQKRGNHDQHNT